MLNGILSGPDFSEYSRCWCVCLPGERAQTKQKFTLGPNLITNSLGQIYALKHEKLLFFHKMLPSSQSQLYCQLSIQRTEIAFVPSTVSTEKKKVYIFENLPKCVAIILQERNTI